MVRGKKKEGVEGTKAYFWAKKMGPSCHFMRKTNPKSPNYKGNAKFFYFPL
jgi:hypothetical protein